MSKTISTTICTTAPAEPTSTYLSKSPCSSFPLCLYCAYSLSVAIAGEKPPSTTPNKKNPTVPTMSLCLALYSISFVFVSQQASALPSPQSPFPQISSRAYFSVSSSPMNSPSIATTGIRKKVSQLNFTLNSSL